MAAPQQAREIITLPDGEGAGDGKVTAPEPAVSAPPAAGPEPAFIDPTAAFPFEWPDADAPKINWQLRSVDQRRPEALRPLEEDVRRVWYRSFERAAVICGRPRYRVPLYVNGYEYVGEVANPRSEDDQALCREAMESVGAALAERGESYRHAVQFPPIDAGNARLAAADLK